PLTRKLYDTLLYMAERPGRLLEKQALLDAVWKDAVVEENTLSRTVSNLRQALGERGSEHRFIETVSGLGYRFIQAVTVHADPAAAATAARRTLSIAVLPFEDLSPERDQAYFADGSAEEVLNRLATVGGLRVIAKSSSFRFRGSADGAQAIGRALGVDYLLSGSVRKGGRDLRITAQLVEAATDSQRWSERFDRTVELESIFAAQDDIARAVAHALPAQLGLAEPAPMHRSTHDLEAYDLFLRGRALTDQASAQSAVRASELFREATRRDPEFAPAWLWLALSAHARLIFAPAHAAQARADLEACAAKTLALAPRWSAAHFIQALIHRTRREWLALERSLEAARTLGSPLTREIEMGLGAFHSSVNDSRNSIEHFRVAATIDPLSLLVSSLLQKELIVAGRYAEAETEYRRSQDLAGDREMAEHLALHALWARGLPFRDQLRRYLDLAQNKPAPVLEDVYRVCDDAPRALDLLRAATAAPGSQSPPHQLVLGWWLAAYGDVEASFAALWRAFVERGFLSVDWLWFPVLA
ncbi:MAG TPA: winged helix-turn-helix domain-containing protein, partial [Gammaproteobacteria bacterium]|nr:winged helix-turn-helix domain-containing protein [Gammaproteobacteria bacterium]